MSSEALVKVAEGKIPIIPIKKKKITKKNLSSVILLMPKNMTKLLVKEYLENNLDWEAHENFKEDVE